MSLTSAAICALTALPTAARWRRAAGRCRGQPPACRRRPARSRRSGAEGNARDIAELHRRAVAVGEQDDVAELLQRREQLVAGHGRGELLALDGRVRTQRTGRKLRVLRIHGVDHLGRRQPVTLQLVGIQPDARRIFRAEQVRVADAADATRPPAGPARRECRSGARRRSKGLLDCRARNIRMSGLAFATTTPCWVTSGRQQRLWPGRPCSAPGPGRCRVGAGREAQRDGRLPLAVRVELKYSRLSMPVSCCSITCVTVDSMVAALAPG
jgi:hypothetical protein